MDNNEQALTPEREEFSGIVEAEEQPEVERLSATDRALQALVDHPDFAAYEDMVKSEIKGLREMRGIDLATLDEKEIGRKFVTANLAADMVESLLLRVREAAKQ